jgi:hypothetical protein
MNSNAYVYTIGVLALVFAVPYLVTLGALHRERRAHRRTRRALTWWRDERQGRHGHRGEDDCIGYFSSFAPYSTPKPMPEGWLPPAPPSGQKGEGPCS